MRVWRWNKEKQRQEPVDFPNLEELEAIVERGKILMDGLAEATRAATKATERANHAMKELEKKLAQSRSGPPTKNARGPW